MPRSKPVIISRLSSIRKAFDGVECIALELWPAEAINAADEVAENPSDYRVNRLRRIKDLVPGSVTYFYTHESATTVEWQRNTDTDHGRTWYGAHVQGASLTPGGRKLLAKLIKLPYGEDGFPAPEEVVKALGAIPVKYDSELMNFILDTEAKP